MNRRIDDFRLMLRELQALTLLSQRARDSVGMDQGSGVRESLPSYIKCVTVRPYMNDELSVGSDRLELN